MENLDFSEDEIEQQLEALGYINIPKHRLHEFKQDLDKLIRHEKSRSLTSSSELNSPRSQNTTNTGPPAYTKVKVQQDNAAAYSSWCSSQAGTSDYGRQVLTSNYSRDNTNFGNRQTSYDSYAQHSVAPKYQCPSKAPNRLEMEADFQHSSFTISQSSTPDRETEAHGRPFIKRKVLRKLKGQVHVCDESTHSEGSGALSGLEDPLGGANVSVSAHHTPASKDLLDQDCELESEDTDRLSDRHSSESDGLPSAFEAYIKGMVRCRSESDIRPKPKSFIRPLLDHPHTRNLKKTDPVAKYFQYKQDWEMFKPPGEKDRKSLHWEIREQLAYHPPPPRPRRVFVPNMYVVPTEKKRSALRWEVRHNLANGLLPLTSNYQL